MAQGPTRSPKPPLGRIGNCKYFIHGAYGGKAGQKEKVLRGFYISKIPRGVRFPKDSSQGEYPFLSILIFLILVLLSFF